MRLVAEDILVDGDKAAIRSTIKGVVASADNPEPTLFEIFRVEHGRLAEGGGHLSSTRRQIACEC
jgi:hypothetical protein